MLTSPEALTVIAGMALVTITIKASGLLLANRLPQTGFIAIWLRQIPGAVLAALVAPAIVTGETRRSPRRNGRGADVFPDAQSLCRNGNRRDRGVPAPHGLARLAGTSPPLDRSPPSTHLWVQTCGDRS